VVISAEKEEKKEIVEEDFGGEGFSVVGEEM